MATRAVIGKFEKLEAKRRFGISRKREFFAPAPLRFVFRFAVLYADTGEWRRGTSQVGSKKKGNAIYIYKNKCIC